MALAGRERDDAGIAVQKSAGSGEVLVIGPLTRAAAAPQAVSHVGERCLDVGIGEVDDPGRARRRAVSDHIVIGEVAVDNNVLTARVTSGIQVAGQLRGELADDGSLFEGNHVELV